MRRAHGVPTHVEWGSHVARDRVAVDELTRGVMNDVWRTDALCAVIPDEFGSSSWQARCALCSTCTVVEVCFWGALIEERDFRTVSGNPPGVRGGVEGGRRRFIMGELTDAELLARYNTALAEYTLNRRASRAVSRNVTDAPSTITQSAVGASTAAGPIPVALRRSSATVAATAPAAPVRALHASAANAA